LAKSAPTFGSFLRIEILEYRQMQHHVADRAELGIGHVPVGCRHHHHRKTSAAWWLIFAISILS